MAGPNKTLVATADTYSADLRLVPASSGATEERSYYSALAGMLGALGGTPKPKVFHAADQKAGHPDSALYTPRQIARGRPLGGLVAARGVVELQGVEDWACLRASNARGSLARLESSRPFWSPPVRSAMAEALEVRFGDDRGWATPRSPSTLRALHMAKSSEGVAASSRNRILEFEQTPLKPQGNEAI